MIRVSLGEMAMEAFCYKIWSDTRKNVRHLKLAFGRNLSICTTKDLGDLYIVVQGMDAILEFLRKKRI